MYKIQRRERLAHVIELHSGEEGLLLADSSQTRVYGHCDLALKEFYLNKRF